jgi:hypothetical protein
LSARVPQPVAERWSTGEALLVRGRRWIVLHEAQYTDCRTLRLTSDEHGRASDTRTFLLPFDRPRHLRSASSLAVTRPRRWIRHVTRMALDALPFGGLNSAALSSVDLLPYQLEPALAMVRHGCTRIMIADAVGLGKTIQAGLILRQLSDRYESLRTLVVTPAPLRDQWMGELRRRFDLRAEIVTSPWLARTARERPPEIGPWQLPGTYICSFELIRRPEVLRPLEDVRWDLLVVDEAHAATSASARRAAVHAIALRARRVLLLTATPHGGDDEEFRALCRIGLPDGRSRPITLLRRSRNDVGLSERRRTKLLAVHLSDRERRAHRLLERYTSCIWREAGQRKDEGARLAATILRKRALSSMASLALSCRRRLSLLQATRPSPDDDSSCCRSMTTTPFVKTPSPTPFSVHRVSPMPVGNDDGSRRSLTRRRRRLGTSRKSRDSSGCSHAFANPSLSSPNIATHWSVCIRCSLGIVATSRYCTVG